MHIMTIKHLSAYTHAAFLEIVLTIVRFPFWWYGKGLLIVANWGRHSIYGVYQLVGLGVWVHNLFVPMFGDTTIAGRLISFGARLFMIVFKSIIVVLYSVLMLIVILLYLIAPPVCVFGIFFHGTGLLVS